eukprot:GFUD01011110.1.p1 GENE.GFUD01011110.1~~GFUD01011110.1.p1  ORF type:complete len:1009 (-),score=246.24 GFUD01011110.1:254-3280(-)
MEPGDDIIDVLYRCGHPPATAGPVNNGSPPPYRQEAEDNSHPYQPHTGQRRPSAAVFAISPNTGRSAYSGTPYSGTPNQRRNSKTSPKPDSRWSTPAGRGTSTPYASTPVLGRYNGGTGRVGYNNTPQVQRRASFTKPSNPSNFDYKSSPLPRSTSAYDSRTPPRHHRTAPVDTLSEYDPYGYNEGPFVDEEPVYVPRSTMVDIIYRNEDDLLADRHKGEELIELPSGARQRKRRIFDPKIDLNMCDSNIAGQSDIRKRRSLNRSCDDKDVGREDKVVATEVSPDTSEDDNAMLLPSLLAAANKLTGLLVMVFLSYQFSSYLYKLHENDLWFSEIMEVEREISFRTEQGLYYSYYKQLVTADSLTAGLKQLQFDNLTESTSTVNILQRFNIYQEVVLAAMYNVYNFRLSPIFFYTYSVFSLQGLYLSALYLLAWTLSGTWVAGVLATLSVTINRFDVTRVNFTVPLREHFSLPFIFWQFLTVGHYLKSASSHSDTSHLVAVYISSLIFTLTWQFAQFVLLIQALVLFCLATVGLLDRDRVCRLLAVSLCVMVSVWYLQFYQAMVITSLIVSLVPTTILSLQSQADNLPRGVTKNIGLSAARIVIAVFITVCLNTILKVSMNQTADNHIFKFLKNKLSKDSTDFETQLYLCNEAFKWLDYNTYARLTASLALPAYALFSLTCLSSYVAVLLTRWRGAEQVSSNGAIPGMHPRSSSRAEMYQKKVEMDKEEKSKYEKVASSPSFLFEMSNRSDLCFHIGQSLPLALLAISTLRMKCFWSPYICVLASVGISDPTLWSAILAKLSGTLNRRVMNVARHTVLICLIIMLASQHKPKIDQEMEDLREFYDPDTVDLMQWIQQNTAQASAISGSMQLMAGVKLCTGRTVTNHPHFEDKNLRDRTKQLYQMYAKTSPEDVFSILHKYNASYIILEDSICLAHRERCSLPDIMDLSNGHIPDDGVRNPPSLVESKFPRFCEEVRYDTAEYRKWFRKVFENKTFRIYKVLLPSESEH